MSKPVFLLSSGSAVGRDRVTNEELCTAFNAGLASGTETSKTLSTPEMVLKLSGISERRLYTKNGILDPKHLSPRIPRRADTELSVQAEFALEAARPALKRSGLSADKIDLVIFAASAIQRPYPALAIEIAGNLGIPGFGLDMNVGCASVTFALSVAEQYLRTGAAKNALVVSAELTSLYTNWRDRGSHFLFGDAAAALVLSTEPPQKPLFELLGTKCWTEYSTNIRNNFGFIFDFEENPSGAPRPDRYFYQNGPKVFKDVVRFVPEFIASHLEENKVDRSHLKRLWLHQANARMNLAIAERFIPDRVATESAPIVLDKFGNSAAAGAAVAFDMYSNDLTTGDLGYLCAFGAGYSAGGALLKRV